MATNRTRVSANYPCPVCNHCDWCSVSSDGTLAACRRVEAGAWKTKTDRGGAPVYLHRLDGEPRAPSAPLPAPGDLAPQRADPDTLHRVYSALLAALPLSTAHRDHLRRRGLPDDVIDRAGYRTLLLPGRARMARELRERFGDQVLRVPGFIVRQRDGRHYLTLAGAVGLLVPVRDTAGRVVALQVRRDDTGDGPRYSWVSSTRYGGPGPGTPIHVPLGLTGPCPLVRITEGALKADVASALSGLPTIGTAGVSSWQPALPILRELGAVTLRLALDADAHDKPAVARALAALAEALAAEGLAVELERWPAPYKGIDDALAAGATIEVLRGDDARRAIAEILAEGTATEPLPQPGPLDRLAGVMAEGAEAVFRDGELLRALARLAEADPAEFACRRAQLQHAGIRLRDLDRALAPLRQEVRQERPPLDVAGCYRVSAGRIVRDTPTKDGPVEVPLATWAGRITEEVVHDDGAERSITLAIEGSLADGTPLPRVEVPADQFAWMRWPVERWGTRAVVLAGAGTADHLRVALQLLSGDVPRRTVFGHTGWREVDGRWYYLHAGGAIGADGPAAGVQVCLPDPLAGFALPAPPAGEDLAAAVRASLAILDSLAPDRIVFSLLAAVYRAALGEAPGPIDFALHLAGPHGVGKTELAARAQQHFGAALDARHLPGAWSSTANALEGLAFAAKDALIVVDDYAPRGAVGDRQRLERDADRLLRAQGNRAGRQRMRADGSLRPARPPRGLILSTGADLPPGESLRGRLLVLEVSPGDVPLDARLTPHQRAAADGRYAQALAGFLRWLAPRYGDLCRLLPGQRAALRERAQTSLGSARTPGIVADLALGLHLFLNFARDCGAITPSERDALARRSWQALVEAAAAQTEHVQAADAVGCFLRLLGAALASGRAHVARPDGRQPESPESWGWRLQRIGAGENEREEWRPQGERIGWVDVADLYLEPEASYAVAQQLARDQGDGLPISPRTLRKRLKERGLLAEIDTERQVLTVRRTLEGQRRDVLHFSADLFSAGKPDQPDQPGANGEQSPPCGGRVPCCQPDQGTPRPDQGAPNPTSGSDCPMGTNGELVGLVGSDTGGSD
jgi:hypothetical protein